jgi:hypothetical protein
LVVVSSLVAALGGCQTADEGADVELSFGRVPRALGEPCSSAPATAQEFLSELDGLRMRVSGPGMRTREQTVSVSREVVMDKVPVGQNRKVLVTGLRGSLALWRGFTKGVNVVADKTSVVSLLLTRVADLTCAHNGLVEGRAFATATPLGDGKVLVVGGISSIQPGQGCLPSGDDCRHLVATGTADVFDPVTGTFIPTGTMNYARAFHAAAALPDGRVIVVGGARTAQYNPLAPFPLVLAQSAGVTHVEMFDPATGAWEDLGEDPGDPTAGRSFAAAVTLPNGQLVFSGGGGPHLWTGTPDDQRSFALRSSVVCESGGPGGPVACLRGPEMAMRRFGHVMAPLLDGTTVVYGGSIETGSWAVQGLDNNGNLRHVSQQAPEIYNGSTFAFDPNRPAFIESTSVDNNVFFASAMRVRDVGLFLVGGVTRADDMPALRFSQPKDQVWFLDEGERYMADRTSSVEWRLAVPRFMGQVVPLGDGRRWVVAGGFTDVLRLTPSAALEFFDYATDNFEQITVGGVPRTMLQARGGLVAAPLPNGTALLVGGMSLDNGSNRVVVDTGEIFTDKVEPSP